VEECLHAFQSAITYFKVLILIRPKGFQMLKLILFFGLSVTTVLSVELSLIFIFYFAQGISFLLCVGKTS
jgi:hypothetical protein